MRRLHYSGGYVITADSVCRAVLRYARALADTQSSDVISIPVIGEAGAQEYAHLLIGPASQLYTTAVSEVVEELIAETLVLELEKRTRALQPAVAQWPDAMEDDGSNRSYDEI